MVNGIKRFFKINKNPPTVKLQGAWSMTSWCLPVWSEQTGGSLVFDVGHQGRIIYIFKKREYNCSSRFMLLLQIENKTGDKTQPWGTPVFKIIMLLPPRGEAGLGGSFFFIERVSDGFTCTGWLLRWIFMSNMSVVCSPVFVHKLKQWPPTANIYCSHLFHTRETFNSDKIRSCFLFTRSVLFRHHAWEKQVTASKLSRGEVVVSPQLVHVCKGQWAGCWCDDIGLQNVYKTQVLFCSDILIAIWSCLCLRGTICSPVISSLLEL